MKCSNLACNRGIGLISYQHGWFSKRRYCSPHCRDGFVADAPNAQQKRKSPLFELFVVAFLAYVGLIVPATLAIAALAPPPARLEASQSLAWSEISRMLALALRQCKCGSTAPPA